MAPRETIPPVPQAVRALAIVVMGVSGSGKSSVGTVLAQRLGLPFEDGDAFHPPANVAKMEAGTPLTDADRLPWLDAIGAAFAALDPGEGMIIACSALKRVYRQRLVAAAKRPIAFVFLDGSRATLQERMNDRKDHFMPASLLDSQLATLEPPGPSEMSIRISVEPPVGAVVDNVMAALPSLAERISAAKARG